MRLTIFEIKDEYREHALAHGKATQAGDYKAANRSHGKLVALIPVIRSFGETGRAALLELMADTDEAVVCWSATHALVVDEARALAVLDSLSKKPGPMGFNAMIVIQQWKKGDLVLP